MLAFLAYRYTVAEAGSDQKSLISACGPLLVSGFSNGPHAFASRLENSLMLLRGLRLCDILMSSLRTTSSLTSYYFYQELAAVMEQTSHSPDTVISHPFSIRNHFVLFLA